VLNKNCDAVEKAEQTPLEYLGCIPYDPEIEKASFDGVPLPDNTKAAQAVRTLLSKMKVI
jgi:CO dehydrogenase nickel-insertion accessory protein CooC1